MHRRRSIYASQGIQGLVLGAYLARIVLGDVNLIHSLETNLNV